MLLLSVISNKVLLLCFLGTYVGYYGSLLQVLLLQMLTLFFPWVAIFTGLYLWFVHVICLTNIFNVSFSARHLVTPFCFPLSCGNCFNLVHLSESKEHIASAKYSDAPQRMDSFHFGYLMSFLLTCYKIYKIYYIYIYI